MKVVLFDGPCNLCQHSIQTLIRMDRRQILKFARLDSNFATSQNLKSNNDRNSVLYLRGIVAKSTTDSQSAVYSESTAAAWILWDLGLPWRIFAGFLFLIPSFIRNAVYRFIAKHRYTWFGKSETCWIMTPKLQNRFIE